MLNLKTFESFEVDDELWVKISSYKAYDNCMRRGGVSAFTKGEVETIFILFGRELGCKTDRSAEELGRYHIKLSESCMEFNHPKANSIDRREMVIQKDRDDWFYIMDEKGEVNAIGSTWYECDGVEGLTDCLKYIFNN